MTLIRDAVALADIQGRLEAVAIDYCYKGGKWKWDVDKLHLTIYNPDGSKFVTLHIQETPSPLMAVDGRAES